MGRFEQTAARLSARLKARVGAAVTYTRTGAGAFTRTPTAYPGNADAGAAPVSGPVRVELGECDWFVAAADLPGEPRAGDRITATIAGTARVFAAAPRGDGPCWRWTDETHTEYRIHTRLVG